MSQLFLLVLNLSVMASLTAVGVLLLRKLLKKALPPLFFYLLWSVVFIRMLLPVTPSSQMSIFQLMPKEAVKPVSSGSAVILVEELEREVLFPVLEIQPPLSNAEGQEPGPPPVSIQNSRLPVEVLFSTIWLFGMAGLIGYGLLCYAITAFHIRNGYQAEESELVCSLRKRLGIRRKIRFCYSDRFDSPMICGIFMPVIVLPYEVNLESPESEHIIAHELVHMKRWDNLIRLAGMLAVYLHWFNPLLWYCYARMTADMEISCDFQVLALEQQEQKDIRKEYAQSLLDLSVKRTTAFSGGVLSFGESSIQERVKTIMNYKKITMITMLLCLAVLAAFGFLFLTNPVKEILEPDNPSQEVSQPVPEEPKPQEEQKAQADQQEKQEPVPEAPADEAPPTETEEPKKEAPPEKESEQKPAQKPEEKAASYFSLKTAGGPIRFQINGSPSLRSEVFTIKDSETNNVILKELNRLNGKKEEGVLDISAYEWNCTVTIPITTELSYQYELYDNRTTTEDGSALIQISKIPIQSGTESAPVLQGHYRPAVGIGTLRAILEQQTARNQEYTCFSTEFLRSDSVGEVLLLDNDTRESVSLSEQKSRLLQTLSQIEVTKVYEGSFAGKTGKLFSGAEELRIKDDTLATRFIYLFYEKGIAVTDEAGNQSFYECTQSSLEQLYQIAEEQLKQGEATPSWLAIMSPGKYDSMQLYNGAGGKRKHVGLIYDHSIDLFFALQGLHVQKGSGTTVKTMPDNGTYYLELVFKTGVSYTINIQDGILTIESSDIPGVLQYTVLEDAEYKEFEAIAAEKVGNLIR